MDPGKRGRGSWDQCGGVGRVSRGDEGPQPSGAPGDRGTVSSLAGGGGGGGGVRPGGAGIATTGPVGGKQRSLDCLHGVDPRSAAIDAECGGNGAGAGLAGGGILIGRYWVRTSDLLRVKQALYR